MNKLLLLFCEGSHEPPYIYRLLKVDGWRNKTDQRLESYPPIIQGYLKAQLQKTELRDEDLWNRSKGFLPWYILEQQSTEAGQQHILIFRLGGDSKYERSRKCMHDFKVFAQSELSPSTTALSFAFFYDADKAVNDRIKRFRENLGEDLPGLKKALADFEQHYMLSVEEPDAIPAGLFIFHDEHQKGALEEHVLPLMRLENETIFSDAENYFDRHYERKRAKGKKRGALVKGKALIGIAGQLQVAGRSNTVVLSDTDYMTDAKIKTSVPAQALLTFVKELLA